VQSYSPFSLQPGRTHWMLHSLSPGSWLSLL
jgi:hypothetical protein